MSIKFRVLLLVGFFMGLMVFNSLAINVWILGAQNSSHAINIAGRQRMLSQKIAKEAMLAKVGVKSASDTAANKELFERSLRALADGDASMNVEKVSSEEVRKKIAAVEGTWRQFRSVLDSLDDQATPAELQRFNDLSNQLLRESSEVVVSIDEEFGSAVGALRALVISFALIAIAAAIAGYWFLHRFVVSRIFNIQRVSERIIAEKDLTMRLTLDGSDELTASARSFNDMVASVVDINRATKDVESELQQQLEMLKITSGENRQSMDLQRSEIIQVSSAVNEMASTVQEVAKNTQDASDVSKRAQDEANHGSVLLEGSMDLTHSLAQEIREASENIEKLAQASDSIGGIADTISTIAEQTNLLALNAAIEAARAGEQGRGFAVVADEVRTLAQRTQDATSEIHKLIATLQESTNASVATMESSKERSEQGVAKAEEMAQALKLIIESVENLSSINHQIAVAADEQSAVADEINNNILKIENKAENTFANAEATEKYTDNLSAMADKLRLKLNEFRID